MHVNVLHLILLLFLTRLVSPYCINTVAGGESAILSAFQEPSYIDQDTYGALVFSGLSSLYRINDDQSTTIRIAGSSSKIGYTGDGGPAASALFGGSLVVIKSIREGGSLLVLDSTNKAVRIIYKNGTIGTYFSCLQTTSVVENINFRSSNLSCSLSDGLVETLNGDLYFSDTNNHRIRKISIETGLVSTIAGNGIQGNTGNEGQATSAMIESPRLLAISSDGYILAFVTAKNVIRQVDLKTGIIKHIAGCEINCDETYGIAIDFPIKGPITGLKFRPIDSALVFINKGEYRIQAILSNGKLETIAGTGQRGRAKVNILATSSNLDSPNGLYFDPLSDFFYISDQMTAQILKINTKTKLISTIIDAIPRSTNSLQDVNIPATRTSLSGPRGLLSTSTGDILISDGPQNTIRILKSDGTIGTFAGNGEACIDPKLSCGDGQVATSAQLNFPYSMAFLKNNDLLIADSSCGKIRKISSTTSIITTIAGTGVIGNENGVANESKIDVSGLAVDDNDNIYIADYKNSRIQKLEGNILTTVAGNNSCKQINNIPTSPPSSVLATTLCIPGPVLHTFGPDKLLYISDALVNTIFRYNIITKSIERFAFIPWDTTRPSSSNNGDGGIAMNAIIFGPSQIAFDSFGNLFVAETFGYRIRKISKSTQVVSTVAGIGINAFTGDGGNPLVASLATPRGLTIDPFDNIFFSEETSYRVRELSNGTTPNCPAGYTCPCGLRPEACSNPEFFCPAGTSQPISVSPGFMSIGKPIYGSTTDMAYYSQTLCPIGKYCSKGLGFDCPSGTFGKSPMQPTSASCRKCEAGSYTAETGATGNACLLCPPGTYTDKAGSTTCLSCPPNTFSITPGGKNVSSCSSCLNGSWSFPWMSTCTQLGKMDFFKVNDTLTTFQRTFEFNDENMGPSRLLRLEILVGAPIFGICCIPLLLAIMAKYCCPNSAFAESIFFILYLLRRNDMFCDLAHPVEKGEAPMRKPTPIGGGFSLSFVGLFLAFSSMVTLEFVFSNNMAVYSLLPMSYLISNIVRTIPSKPADSGDLNDQFPLLSSGFAVYIQTSGRFCGTPLQFSQNLVQGNFRNISLFDPITGDAMHVFQCGDCFTDELSFFVATFHPSCTKFTVSVVTVGAWGSINARMLDVESTSYVLGSFELKPELSIDFVNGTDDENNPNYPKGGKTFRGYDLGYVYVYSYADVNPEKPVPTTVRIELPLAPMYSRVTVTPILTYFNLVSTYIGNLGVLGGAAVAFGWYLFVLDKFRTIKHGKPIFVIFGSSFKEAKNQWGLEYFRDPPTKEVNKDHRDTKQFIADAFKNDPRYKDLYANKEHHDETGQRSASAGPSLDHSFSTNNPLHNEENSIIERIHGRRSTSISTVRKIMPAISIAVNPSRWSAFNKSGGEGETSKYMMELRNRDTGQSWYIPVRQKIGVGGALVGAANVYSKAIT